MYNYGGIYLDTDVEMLRRPPLEDLLDYRGVLVFEYSKVIATGLMYLSNKGDVLCKAFLNKYEDVHFSTKRMIMNVQMNKPVIIEVFPDLIWNGRTQIINEYYFMGQEEYAQSMRHLGTHSWIENDFIVQDNRKKEGFLISKLRSPQIANVLNKYKRITRFYEFVVYDLHDYGALYYIKRIFDKWE